MCRAHDDGRICTARDYIFHAIDMASDQLQSPRHFPPNQTKSLHHSHVVFAICRQLARIFSHLYLHHRSLFERCEQDTALYARFKKLTEEFQLLQADFLPI